MDWDLRSKSRSTGSKAPSAYLHIEAQSVNLYIARYFEQVHPIYPFLQRHEFERKALDNRCSQFCKECAPFSALYHTVLALGCQRLGGETFRLGCSPSWKLFQVALGLFAEMITTKETLTHVQAMIAMAVFARNSSAIQIERLLTTEAARIAQSIGINRAMYADEEMELCQRAFWMIYILEKTQTFACGRDSILIDSNIGTPVPRIPDALFGGFNYFHTLCRFSRVLSKAKDTLFSISATLVPSSKILTNIDALTGELECWKKSICEDFQPGNDFQQSGRLDSLSIALKLMLSYQYHGATIALARLKVNVASSEADPSKLQAEQVLLRASRSIIELTRYIDVETYTPIWTLLSVPLSAIFILFDFVIRNPCHSETKSNIALLGIAAGYFCRLEFSSGGILQTSLLSDLAQIARDYISDMKTSATAEPMEFLGTPYSYHHSQPEEEELEIRPALPASVSQNPIVLELTTNF
ncbi:unnamed protein product [Penicillium egyptiacum]|uniref:Xylanolytic transcriptional activator regulatory domain-containing protein n=1 Tax=Penicillium egyptiacum TaxID=1303716 RepID=A0A9W4P6U0_9EURO|nr:unnamed protein product [Penicillium egyptiacum]